MLNGNVCRITLAYWAEVKVRRFVAATLNDPMRNIVAAAFQNTLISEE
jgi:hypothetical protein